MLKRAHTILSFRSLQQSPSLFYNTVHSLATIIISIILSLATSVIIARGLGPTAKGKVDLIIATTNLLVMAFGLSLPSGIVYVIARGRASIRLLIPRLFLIACFQTIVAGIFLTFILQSSLSDAILPKETQYWSFWAILLLILFNLLSGYFFGILAGLQEFPKANFYGVIGKIFSILAISSLFLISMKGEHIFNERSTIWIITASSIASALIFLIPVTSIQKKQQYDYQSGLKEIFSYSLPAYFANLVQHLSYRLDIFIVNFFLGVREVGLYALALNIGQTIWLFSGTISNVLYPNIASSTDETAIRERTTRIAKLTFWTNVFLALILAVIARELLPFVYGSAFQESVSSLLWLLPGIATFGITNVISSYVVGIGKPRLTFWFAIVCLFTMIALDIWLVPLWGIDGASIASSMAYFVTTLVSIAVFVRESGAHPLRMVIPDREDMHTVIGFLKRILPENT